MPADGPSLVVSEEVRAALDAGSAVVALESSLIAQGLPSPHNIETALAAEAAVRGEGAVPATVAIDAGHLLVGVTTEVLERLADTRNAPAKAASRDLGPLLAAGRLAATTVSATVRAAHWAGIELFATGGIGGVHRGAGTSFDVSSDIDELAATHVAVVSSGAKSILDLPATIELLETRRIPVIGLGVDELPAFYAASSGLHLSHRVDTPRQAADAIRAHFEIPGSGGILFVQPPPADVAMPADALEGWIATAVAAAEELGIRGGSVTPFVLARVADASGGRTLRANVALVVNNARVAAQVAVACTAKGHS
jgi:pseudouridine-5'-phosphate glycosidase